MKATLTKRYLNGNYILELEYTVKSKIKVWYPNCDDEGFEVLETSQLTNDDVFKAIANERKERQNKLNIFTCENCGSVLPHNRKVYCPACLP